jgi:hypothetical protein
MPHSLPDQSGKAGGDGGAELFHRSANDDANHRAEVSTPLRARSARRNAAANHAIQKATELGSIQNYSAAQNNPQLPRIDPPLRFSLVSSHARHGQAVTGRPR